MPEQSPYLASKPLRVELEKLVAEEQVRSGPRLTIVQTNPQTCLAVQYFLS
jgi:hypothetical protein